MLDDLAFCSGLLRGAGDDGTVIYAANWAARRLGLSASTVSVTLRKLRAYELITLVKVLPPLEKGRAGSRVYAITPPCDVLPPRPRPIEATRPAAIHQREETRDHVPVAQAVADDSREVAEADGRPAATATGAGSAAGAGIGHAPHFIPEAGGSVPAAAEPDESQSMGDFGRERPRCAIFDDDHHG